jgi:uncharacterized protein YfbU (UPF0304 family)
VNFSDGEKLIAIMLADIMKANKIDGEVDPDFITEAVTSGHLWMLKWKYPGIYHEDDDDPEVVKETADILDMCRVLEGSINALDEAERNAIPEDDRAIFFGFDGNHEPHIGVARMFIEKLDLWQEFKDRPLNSHMSTLNHYRRLKERFDRSPRPLGGTLSLDQIRQIISGEPAEMAEADHGAA